MNTFMYVPTYLLIYSFIHVSIYLINVNEQFSFPSIHVSYIMYATMTELTSILHIHFQKHKVHNLNQIDARIRALQPEYDRITVFPGQYVDSMIIHGRAQRFLTK